MSHPTVATLRGATYTVTVDGSDDTKFDIAFGGSLKYRALPLVRTDVTSATGTTPTITVTRSTSGLGVSGITQAVAWTQDASTVLTDADLVVPVIDRLQRAVSGQPPAIAGTAAPGSVVEIYQSTSGVDSLRSTVIANDAGRWFADLSAYGIALNDRLFAKSRASIGAAFATEASQSVEFLQAGPSLEFGPISGDEIVNAVEASRGLIITGSTDVSATSVTLTAPNSVTKTAGLMPGVSGQTWSIQLSASELQTIGPGSRVFDLTAVDTNGVESRLSRTVDLKTIPPAATASIGEVDGQSTAIVATSKRPIVEGSIDQPVSAVRVYLKEGAILLGTVTPAEKQAIALNGASAGSYTLSLEHSGQTYTTGNIAFDANAATVQTALESASNGGSDTCESRCRILSLGRSYCYLWRYFGWPGPNSPDT